MRIPDGTMRWLAPAIISVIGAGLIFGNPISKDALCNETDNCLVAWTGALSGWAALAGALLTVAVMQRQLTEQRRQTDYLLGDSEPEIYVDRRLKENEGKYSLALIITIVNRNRRPFWARTIEFTQPTDWFDLVVTSTTTNGHPIENPFAELLRSKNVGRTAAGRSEGVAPPTLEIECQIYGKYGAFVLDTNSERWTDYQIAVTVHGELKDAKSRPIALVASIKLSF